MGAVDARTDLAGRPEVREAQAAEGLNRRLNQLPDGHPSSPRYADGSRQSDGGERTESDRVRPLTDAEHAEHVADIKTRLADARAAGFETANQHTLDIGHEVWNDTRDAMHQEVVEHLYARSANVPCEWKAILAGGLPGAGKTTVLRDHAGLDLSRYLMVNPDDIKEEMARRGLVPTVRGLSPMEAGDLVHEESSHIAKRLARKAQADGKNVIWDVTLSKAESAAKRIDSLRAGGYRQVDGIFVDVPIAVSARRADARHRQGHDAYRAGLGLGGRLVREEVIYAQADETWGSLNRATFEKVKDRFDSWAVYGNSVDGHPPVLVAADRRVHDVHQEDRR